MSKKSFKVCAIHYDLIQYYKELPLMLNSCFYPFTWTLTWIKPDYLLTHSRGVFHCIDCRIVDSPRRPLNVEEPPSHCLANIFALYAILAELQSRWTVGKRKICQTCTGFFLKHQLWRIKSGSPGDPNKIWDGGLDCSDLLSTLNEVLFWMMD